MATTSPLPTQRKVIVIGSGLAGLSASSTLISRGIPVHLLERAAKTGGNSIKASSGINGAPTKYQPGDNPDTFFYRDTIKSAGSVIEIKREKRENLIKVLTDESKDAVEWLVEKGVDLSVVAQLGGHSFPRTHRGSGKVPPGAAIITTLLKSLQESPLFKLETGSSVTEIMRSGEGVVEGVKYENAGKIEELKGPVIVTSGGFAGDSHGMVAKYRPDLAGIPSTNEARPGSQHLLTSIGAQLIDMEKLQIHPTSFVDPKDALNPVKFLAAEMLRGEGGIMLFEGKRFINELETRKVVTEKIMGLETTTEEGVRQWDVQLVLDEGTYEASRNHVDFYLWKGLMQKVKISDLPHPDESLKTIRDYCKHSTPENSVEDEQGRIAFGRWNLKSEDVAENSIVYVGRVTPAIHFTMGGVLISQYAEVLDEQDKVIQGVWAAGEVTGGVHGGNRLGGSSLLECVVFGRRAGEAATIFMDSDPNI